MKSIKGTLTEQNLLKAFAGESQARNRYSFFASRAKKEGYEQIAAIFLETAEQEKEHAKRFFKFMEGGMANIYEATYPAGRIGTTSEKTATKTTQIVNRVTNAANHRGRLRLPTFRLESLFTIGRPMIASTAETRM